MKVFICVDFFQLLDIFNVCKFTINFSFDNIAKFFPNFIIFIKKISSFFKKYVHLVLSKPLLYILMFGRNMDKGIIFLSSL